MNSLCPRHQHDACPQSPSQPRSAGPADELIDRSLLGVYAKRSTHRAREAGGSNGAPKTQVVLAILADRTSMMLMTCQVTPSGLLGVPGERVDVTRPLDSQEGETWSSGKSALAIRVKTEAFSIESAPSCGGPFRLDVHVEGIDARQTERP